MHLQAVEHARHTNKHSRQLPEVESGTIRAEWDQAIAVYCERSMGSSERSPSIRLLPALPIERARTAHLGRHHLFPAWQRILE